ncbi:hypothetical protein [Neisseria dentiae]|nr:hypothetical protein [Neisseria dentiae]
MKQLDQHGLNKVSGGVVDFGCPTMWDKLMKEYLAGNESSNPFKRRLF